MSDEEIVDDIDPETLEIHEDEELDLLGLDEDLGEKDELDLKFDSELE